MKDGRVLTGLIAAETASAITLKRQEGQSDVVLRADLDQLTTAGKSLMPEGLENDLKPADLADLMAYLAQGSDRPKNVEGNNPRLVSSNPDGSIRLVLYSDVGHLPPALQTWAGKGPGWAKAAGPAAPVK